MWRRFTAVVLVLVTLTVIQADDVVETAALKKHKVYKALKKSLLDEDVYDKEILPHIDEPTVVRISYPLVTVVNLESDTQLAQYVINEYKVWTDPRLVWNPEKHGNISHIYVKEISLWVPTTSMYNTFDNHQIFEEYDRYVRVENDGKCLWNKPHSILATCALSLKFFPFDVQDCQFQVCSPQFTVDEVDFAAGFMKTIGGNAEWLPIDCQIITRTIIVDGHLHAALDATVRLQRNYIYYVMVLAVPTFVISVISVFGIFTAEGSVVEKIGLGLANLLAMSVMLGIVADSLPKSNELTILGHYLLYTLITGSVAVVCSVSVDFCINKITKDYQTQPPPYWLYWALRVQPRRFKSKLQFTIEPEKKPLSFLRPELIDLAAHFKRRHERDEELRYDAWADHEWIRVLDRIEILLIALFQAVNVSFFIWFLTFASQMKDHTPFPPMKNATIAYYSGDSLARPYRVTYSGIDLKEHQV